MSLFKISELNEQDNNILQFLLKEQLMDETLWRLLVQQFSECRDSDDLGWRGEYWGKIMRGACLILKHMANDKLYMVLEKTVKDLLKCQDNEGRISTYMKNREFCGWDLWGRKYVNVGLESFLEICKDKTLSEAILTALRKQCDYIIRHIGNENEKIEITNTSNAWGGMNSCSILKSFVVLYKYTKDNQYLDFAKYIIEIGGSKGFDLFEAAFDETIKPFNYPYKKAYEMISCYEGALEYYKETNDKHYLDMCIRFAQDVMDNDITIVGGTSCYHELFDRSEKFQIYPTNFFAQETCITISLMIYFNELYKITGDFRYIDVIEIMYYNLYMGTLNTNRISFDHPLPFDSYSPLINGVRGSGIGGKKYLNDQRFYGCCAAIGSAGYGVFMDSSSVVKEKCLIINSYGARTIRMAVENKIFTVKICGNYPLNGKIKIEVFAETSTPLQVAFRIPYWCEKVRHFAMGSDVEYSPQGKYFSIRKNWEGYNTIEFEFDMRTMVEKRYNNNNKKKYFCVKRGPFVFASDARFCNMNHVWKGDPDIYKINNKIQIEEANIALKLTDEIGGELTLIDYSSAGKTWDSDSTMSCWLQYED